MEIKKHLLPHTINGKRLWRTPRKSVIDSVIIHYVSAVNIDETRPFEMSLIYDIFKQYGFSAHYLIERDGKVWKMVQEKDVAFHAGVSSLYGRSIGNSCNDFSIGIELVGGKWIDYTEEQYASLVELLKEIRGRYHIKNKNIVGHNFIAPKRKVDPGKHFDWDRVYDSLTSNQIVIPIKEELKKKERAIEVLIAKNEIEKKHIIVENNISSGDVSWFSGIMESIKKLFNKG